MGGGAGLNFSLKITNGYCRWHPVKRVFDIARTPEIERFDMHGYMDGLSNVRGELLRIVNFEIEPLDPADSDWLRRHGVRASQELYLGQPSREKIECMIWGGYVRGDIRATVPSMTFTADLDVEGVGVRATFGIEATDEFFEFYQDVFENWCYNTEQDMADHAANYSIAA